jgi:hypothetical protein
MSAEIRSDGKTKLHFEKWKKGTTTELMLKHIQKHHREERWQRIHGKFVIEMA